MKQLKITIYFFFNPKFQSEYWGYYKELIEYKINPTQERSEELSVLFDQLFSTLTGYEKLDQRIKKTRGKESGLLAVLDYPEIPLLY